MPKKVEQLGMDERTVVDADLLDALDVREGARERLSAVRKAFYDADDKARAAIETLGLEVGEVVRVGPYRIENRHVDEAEVEFTRQAKDSIRITLPKAE